MNHPKHATPATTVTPFTAEPLDLLFTMSNPQSAFDFVLPGMLAGTIGSLVSPGGTGKSFLALQLALRVGTGHDLLGLDVGLKVGRVAMFCLEDPKDALCHRIHALGKSLSHEVRTQMQEQVQIFPLLGSKTDIFDESFFAWMANVAAGTRLIIIDTLRRIHSEDENDSGRMSDLLARMEMIATKTGCAILFLHHTTKNAALGGQADMQQASRGSSVLTDNIRWQSYLAVMTESEASAKGIPKPERRRFVRFGVSKQNYGPPLDEMWLERGVGGILRESSIAVKAGVSSAGVKPSAKKKHEWMADV